MKTADRWASEYLVHRTTYEAETDLAEKKRARLVSMFAAAMADARRAALEEALHEAEDAEERFSAEAESDPANYSIHCARSVGADEVIDRIRALLDDAGNRPGPLCEHDQVDAVYVCTACGEQVSP